MVTVLYRQRHGYDVVIHTEDHFPAHVHVLKGDKEVLLRLDSLDIIDNFGFNVREVRQIQRLLRRHEALIVETWERLHGSVSR